jgi:hypothetical protein
MADLIPMLAAVAGQAGEEADEDFNQTVLLLHGDGTNGAQNNTFLDGSTNNFTITRNGNTTQGTFSPFSLAAGEWSNFFDGSGDSLTFPANAAFDFGSGNFTVEAWVYLAGNSPTDNLSRRFANIFSVTASSTFNFAFTIDGNSTTTGTGLSIYNGSTSPAVVGTINQNTWNHIAVSKDGTSVYFWLNGTQLGSTQTTSGNWGSSANGAQTGRTAYTAANYSWDLNGYISNLRVIKGTALYTSAFTPSTTPLTAITNTSLLTCQSNRFVDNSTNAFAITRNGDVKVTPFSPFAPTAAYSASTNGGSGYFDGSGDSLTAPDNAAFDVGSGDWTIECFANFGSVSGEKGLFSHFADVAGNTNGYTLRLSTGNSPSGLRLVCSSNNTNVILQAAWTPVVSAWYHIAAVRDGGTLRVYVDGVQIGSISIAITIGNPATTFAIGTTQTVASSDMNGYISNVRMIKGTCLYTGGTTFTPPTAPLTAVSNTQLLCNFTNAGIFDNTGKNNLETVGDAQIDTTTKKYGTGSMEFDGTGDWLRMESTPPLYLSTGPFTIEAWIYPNNNTAGQILGRQSAATARGIALVYGETSQKFTFSAGDTNNAAWEVQITSTNTFSSSQWHHVAITRNASNVFTLWVNGVSEGTATNSVVIADDSSPFYIGSIIGAASFNGFIDDLRITKGVARYTAAFTPPTKAFPDQ